MSEKDIAKEKNRSRHDELFKQLLETFFFEFVDLFFPEVSRLMDKNYLKFLKQEVITDVVGMDKHIVDILAETKLADEEGLVLIHMEGQAQRLPDYNKKMFKYFARLHEKHQRKILPIVVYSHDAKLDEEDNYKVEFSFLKVLEFNFLMLQLRKMSWRKYIENENPVAAAIISQMNYTEKERIAVKIEFSRMLSNMQLDSARRSLLVAYFENNLKLTEDEEAIYRDRLKQELSQQEVEKLLEITTSYHEEGKAEGIRIGEEKGKIEGKIEVAKKMLAKEISVDEIVEITELTREQVEDLKKQQN